MSVEKLDFQTSTSSILHSFDDSGLSGSPRNLSISNVRPTVRTPIPLGFPVPLDYAIPITPGVQRVLNRLQYKKLRRLIRICTVHMDLKLLERFAPTAALMLTDRTVELILRLRLDGRCWPPLMVYQAEVSGAKRVSVRSSSTGHYRGIWRTVVTDKPMLAAKQQLSPIMKKELGKTKGVGLKLTPRTMYRKEDYYNYTWKNKAIREAEERPDFKYRRLETSGTQLQQTIPIRYKKRKNRLTDQNYIRYWNNVYVVKLAWKRGLPANSFIL